VKPVLDTWTYSFPERVNEENELNRLTNVEPTVKMEVDLASYPVVKLLSTRWWISTGTRPEGPKLAPEGPRAEVGFPTTDQVFSSIQGTLFRFYVI